MQQQEQPELTPEEREEGDIIKELLASYTDQELFEYFNELILLKREIEESELARCAETGELPFWEQPSLFSSADYEDHSRGNRPRGRPKNGSRSREV